MRFVITAYANGAFQEFRLPALYDADHEILLSSVCFRLTQDLPLRLEVLSGVWKIMEGENYTLEDQKKKHPFYILHDGLVLSVNSAVASVTIIVSGEKEELPCFSKYDISNVRVMRIGKQPGCEVQYDFMGLVSKVHAILTRDNGMLRLEDTSTNGTFINGKRLRGSRPLLFGDCVNILGLKIVCLGDALAIYAGGLPVALNTSLLQPYTQPTAVQKKPPKKLIPFKRAPRVVEELVHEPVEIEGPPPPNKPKKQPLLMTIGPAFTMMIPMMLGSGMAILSANASGGMSSTFMYTGIITAASSALIGVMWTLVNLRYGKNQQKEEELLRFNLYQNYLVKIADKLKTHYYGNTKTLNNRYPSAQACMEYGLDPTRLWCRNFSHNDFLFVRLGIGGMPFQVPIQIPKERFSLVDDSLADKPRQIQENFRVLKDVPVGVDLRIDSLWGIYGNGTMEAGLSVVRSMAVQIAANNCYTDVKLVFIYDKKYEESLAFAQWLPHVWSEDKKVRYIASNRNEIGDVLYALGNTLRIRLEQENMRSLARPHYVVFVCNPELLEGEPVAKFLLEPSEKLGLSTVLVAESYEALPNICTNLIQHDEEFKGFYDVCTVDAQKIAVEFDVTELSRVETFARWLSGVCVSEMESGGEITNSLTFFEMHGVQSLGQFAVQDCWRKNRTYENMRALVGQKAGGTNLYLDIHEKYHGPHGLVAGTTGSGKSETLQTYILSLALNFSPLDVGFFIIDYKGGGMANLFSDLPHMLGQISNLSGNQVRRAMVSIKSEIKRRQRIFGEYDVNHLDQYTRLLKNGEARVPIPHMVIIIDEFAELKREEPDFMRELISVAQVGRSLGIHLILATQKPAGTVDDNIWSNSKFKLCLRVQDRQDSMDMLKRPDAAYLTQAGRCYIQVGNDEIFELFQSGWSGAAYDEDIANAKAEVAIMISKTGQPSLVGNRSKLKRKEQKRLRWLGVVMDCAVEASKEWRKSIFELISEDMMRTTTIDALFTGIWARGYDYPKSQYNAKRLEEFLTLLAQVEANTGLHDQQAALHDIQRRAMLSGIRLPEEKEKSQLAAVVEYLRQQAQESGLQTNLTLWLPVLPTHLYLADIPGYSEQSFCEAGWPAELTGQEWTLRAIVGLCDDPVNQAQLPVDVNFARDGHVAVCGMVVSGKSTFLQTLIYSLVDHYSPKALNMYILDYSSRMLGCFAEVKHCGGVVFEDQRDRTGKLFTMLSRELERRKKLFEGGNYAQYVRAHGVCEPAIVLVVDGFANFKEKTDNCYEDILITLSREGANYGLYLVLAAGGFGMSEIQNRIGENIKTVFCLQMGDKFKYGDTLRTRVDTLPELGTPGRGLMLAQGIPLEFQTAISLPAEDDYRRGEAISELIARINAFYKERGARPIPEIPENPTWEALRENETYHQILETHNRLPLGYVETDADVCSLNLRKVFTFMVAGWARTGKSNALRCLMQAAHDRRGQIIVIDSTRGELQGMALELGARYVCTEETISAFAQELYQEMVERNALKRALRGQGVSDDEVFEKMQQFPAHYLFIDDFVGLMQIIYSNSVGMQSIVGFMENFFDKGALHNIYVFAGIPLEEYNIALGYHAFKLATAGKTGLLLGGDWDRQKLFDFSGMLYSERSKKHKPGVALMPPDEERERPQRIVLPMA